MRCGQNNHQLDPAMNRIFQMLKIAASFIIPSDVERGDPRSEAASTKPGLTVTVLGVLLMHVVLVGAILACAGLSRNDSVKGG
jgi:hypothetical protein